MCRNGENIVTTVVAIVTILLPTLIIFILKVQSPGLRQVLATESPSFKSDKTINKKSICYFIDLIKLLKRDLYKHLLNNVKT